MSEDKMYKMALFFEDGLSTIEVEKPELHLLDQWVNENVRYFGLATRKYIVQIRDYEGKIIMR